MARSLYAALLMLSLIWGGSFFFIKILLQDFGPWSIAFLRSGFGFVAITVIMFVLRKPFELRKIPWLPMIIVALINTSIPWALIGFSETRVTSSMASVLNAMTPLWTLIVGLLFFQAVSNRKQWLGMSIAFIGLIILLGINPITIISVDILGFVCMITATLCYAFGSQLSKRYFKEISMYQITFGTLLCGMVGSGVVAFVFEPITVSHIFASTNFLVLIGLGVFGSGIAYVLYYYMIQKGNPEFASMVTYLVPASAIIWGYTLLDEHVHWTLLVGLVFILGGVYLASKQAKTRASVNKSPSSEVGL